MSFWANTIVQLIFLQYLYRTASGIIVEKNYYFYYKLPTEITADHTTENFFLLKCPYRETLEIPLLKEMSMCRIIARYGALTSQFPKHVETSLPANFKHTHVTYRMKQPNTNTMSATASYFHITPKVIIKPMPMAQIQPQVQAEQRAISSVLPMNFSMSTVRKPTNNNENMSLESSKTSLKFLGVGDTINKLFSDQKAHKVATDDNDDDLIGHSEKQRFFTIHSNYGNGEKSRGFQNMYYRDEISNDHIFYDDIHQHGYYHKEGKQVKLN